MRFYDILNTLIDKYVPKVHISSSYIYPTWYNRALINAIEEKARLHHN